MRRAAVLLAGAVTGAIVWIASTELQWPARLLMAILLGPALSVSLLQAASIDALDQLPPRMHMYAGSIALLIALGGAALLAGTQSNFTARIMALRPIPLPVFALWTLFAILACGAVVTAFKAFGYRESAIMHELTPVTLREKATFVGLSISAGVGEELAFRSFLIPALMVATSSILAGVGLSSAAFGFMHAHQRTGGALRATLLGLILAFPMLVTGSVYPSMAAHALIDVIGGLWMARWLVT